MLIQNIISYEQFKEYLINYKYIIVNIGAKWCKPCNAIKPQIEKFISVIDESNYLYLKLDYSIFEEYLEFNDFFKINKIPYFAFIKNSVIIDSINSGDFNVVSKKLFENISREREDDKIKFSNLNINEDF
jgi:thiol-disulfide isomerase/thioredoxin